MSRIGKVPVKIPSGVSVTLSDDKVVIDGPKGSLSQHMVSNIKINQSDGELSVAPLNDEKKSYANQGLMRTLLHNMVTGVSQGFEKKLEVNGVGFRVSVSGDKLVLSIGYSHPVNYQIPQGIQISTQQNTITVSGTSKQQVGQAAAEIRSLRKPEPYKGKGIQYAGERIIRKSGKSGKE